jgi:pectinesterase
LKYPNWHGLQILSFYFTKEGAEGRRENANQFFVFISAALCALCGKILHSLSALCASVVETSLFFAIVVIPLTLQAAEPSTLPDHYIVAADGSGDFTTVQAAVEAVAINNNHRVVIDIRPGTYLQVVHVPKYKPMITFRGEDAAKTILTFNNSAKTLGPDGQPLGTFASASVFIDGDDFHAENITFENTFGVGSQAVAIHVAGDRAVFSNCRFLGWQDTLMTGMQDKPVPPQGREYYDHCYITGHVDFIFGGATAYFSDCEIHLRGRGYVTAAATPQSTAFGYVFDHCHITADPAAKGTYLGRPWRPYASVTYLNTEMPAEIRPEGWENWRDPAREKTARYAEFQSTGPGGDPSGRVAWAHQLTADEAAKIIPQSVLGGDDHWDPTAELPATRPVN